MKKQMFHFSVIGILIVSICILVTACSGKEKTETSGMETAAL